MPLVLTQNEVVVSGPKYADVTGVVYHFPQLYRSLIKGDIDFVYYRGSRRGNGKRQAPEYFGYGRIGEVWQDPVTLVKPKKQHRWFAEIVDFHPFVTAVPAASGGRYLEPVTGRRYWSRSVRQISPELFSSLLTMGFDAFETAVHAPDVARVLHPKERQIVPEITAAGARVLTNLGTANGSRRSQDATAVGRQGEEIAWKVLQTIPGSTNHRWHAREGTFPGYDMSYLDAAGELRAVEVKSSARGDINYVEVTANEWSSAELLRERYQLWLVIGCMSTSPSIETITDPFGRCGQTARPTGWSISTARSA